MLLVFVSGDVSIWLRFVHILMSFTWSLNSEVWMSRIWLFQQIVLVGFRTIVVGISPRLCAIYPNHPIVLLLLMWIIRATGRQSIASIVFPWKHFLLLVLICFFPICVSKNSLHLWKAPVILLILCTYSRFRYTGSILNSWSRYHLMKIMKIEGFYHVPIVVSVMKNVHGGVRISGEPIW